MKLVPDPVRFTVLRHAWELRLHGTSIDEILVVLRDRYHLTTPLTGRCGGTLISRSNLHRIFTDPFYAGTMVRSGESYEGSHVPMVTRAEFELAANQRASHSGFVPATERLWFTYRGLIRCGSCSSMITAEFTTNRHGNKYTYYHCARKNRRFRYCPERSLEEKGLEQQLGHHFA